MLTQLEKCRSSPAAGHCEGAVPRCVSASSFTTTRAPRVPSRGTGGLATAFPVSGARSHLPGPPQKAREHTHTHTLIHLHLFSHTFAHTHTHACFPCQVTGSEWEGSLRSWGGGAGRGLMALSFPRGGRRGQASGRCEYSGERDPFS